MTDLATLADAIAKTLSPDVNQRKAAESFLQETSSTKGFAVSLLQLIALDSAPQHVRQAAAVYMKNHTIAHYSRSDWAELPPDDRNAVKAAIVKIMLTVPLVVRRQLSEVLAIVSEHEYPTTWPDLVPELGAKLTAMIQAATSVQQGASLATAIDWVALEGVLETLHVIFERYPERSRSNELYTEINYSLKHTQEQVLALFELMNKVIHDAIDEKDKKLVTMVFGDADLLCKVFYCLCWQQLPEYMEDHMQSFMMQLRKLLVFESAKIDAFEEDEPSCVDRMHASTLEIMHHFAFHYDEEFRPYLPQFLGDAWALLVRRSNASKYDSVVTAGIKFLTAVSRSPDYHHFKDASVLAQVCKSIVVPNIELREEDEELFEDNPVEYVRRDMEGSDTETRRRGAVELVKGLCVHYEREVTDIFSAYVQEMLAPESDWRKRDTAIYVVTALGWKRGTVAAGAIETSALINVVEFFHSFIMPELSKSGSSAQQLRTPILTADLIKFVISFRNQIPKADCAKVILVCEKLLAANESVVRTYAAACIERILTVKDNVSHANGNGTTGPVPSVMSVPRMSKEDIAPILPTLLPAVIGALQDKTRANEYSMRLVLRLCSVLREGMGAFLGSLLPTLVQIVVAVTANPQNPLFNHYLFESISALIRFNGNSATVAEFESALLSRLCQILIDDVTEFAPYVFQVMSQLMALHSGALPSTYGNLMGPILNPTMWEKRGYIPGMVQFIDTYIRKNSAAVVSANQLEPILGSYQKLLASKATDHYGLQLLDAIFETYDAKTIGSFVEGIFSVLMVRLTKAKTAKLCSRMLCTVSIFVLRFGVSAMKLPLDQLQANMFASFISEVWLPEVIMIRKPDERRLCALALTELACGADDLCLNPPYLELWPRILNTNVALTEGIVLDKAKKEELIDAEEEEAPHLGAGESYSAAHSKLKWAAPQTGGISSLVGQKDPRAVLASKLKEFTGRHAGKFEIVMQEKVDGKAREAIASYMNLVKVA